jgi:beta-ketoacyl-acyl-carrier-protein synthase II
MSAQFSPAGPASVHAQRVVITGMGAITPVGNTVEAMWNGMVAGTSGTAPVTLFDSTGIDPKVAGEVREFDPAVHFGAKEVRRLDRVSQLALVAAREALEQSKLPINDDNCWDIALIIGSGIGGITTLVAEHNAFKDKGPRRVSPFTVPMMLPDTAMGQIAIHFGIRGPNFGIATACASAVNAIGEAFEMIRSGRVQAAVTGGCEAPIDAYAMQAFHNMNALTLHNDSPESASRPFDKTRSGFVCAEGAAMLVLESLEHAQARSAPILGEVVGYGSTDDAFHITAPNEYGPAMSMRRALRQAALNPSQIDYINAHGTSTPLNDLNETKAIKSAFGEAAYDVSISSTKSMTGHSLGAVGAIEVVACVKALQDGIVPPTINYHTPDPECDLNYTPNSAIHKPLTYALTNSFGFGGHNGTLILKKHL